MRLLKHLIRFYINSSIHVALAVISLLYITVLEFDLNIDHHLLFFVFFATISGYNFVKYFGLAKFHHRRLATWLKAIQVFSFFCFIGLVYFASKLPPKTLLYFGLTGVVTFLYAIPLLPKKWFIDKNASLRQISGLKIYVIALVWSLVVVVIPLLHNEELWHHDATIKWVQLFLFVFVVMLPFEIRDLNYDSVRLGTIPQRIGILKTKGIGTVLGCLFFMLEFLKDETTQVQLVIYGAVTLIMLVLLWLSEQRRSFYFSAFWVEAIPIFWLALLLVFGE